MSSIHDSHFGNKTRHDAGAIYYPGAYYDFLHTGESNIGGTRLTSLESKAYTDQTVTFSTGKNVAFFVSSFRDHRHDDSPGIELDMYTEDNAKGVSQFIYRDLHNKKRDGILVVENGTDIDDYTKLYARQRGLEIRALNDDEQAKVEALFDHIRELAPVVHGDKRHTFPVSHKDQLLKVVNEAQTTLAEFQGKPKPVLEKMLDTGGDIGGTPIIPNDRQPKPMTPARN